VAIPENAETIYKFLVSAGLSANAAAGILGNIEQESGGNQNAGSNPPGSGLIQQLGYPTGTTLQAAMEAIITYIKANGSIADINANASTPSAAALYFSNNYEKPDAALANNANREQSADEVAAAAKSGNWGTGGSTAPTTGGGLLSIPQDIIDFFSDADKFVNGLFWLIQPGSWVRIAAFLIGIGLLLFGIHAFLAVGEGEPIMPKLPSVMPVPV
jgi:Phage tail lysozyme